MHKQRILNFREPEVDIILRQQLAKEGYRVLPKVGLSDALAKDHDDHLPQREFDYFTRAHLDFLVTRDNMPVFAVEFDGAHHFIDDRTIENDVIKNRLCKEAGLPLLRITSTEVEEYDKLTLLDYMLMRYVAWGKEYPQIIGEIKEIANTLPPNSDPEDYAVDLDPSFHFDLRHPFPSRDRILERLWRNHKIAWTMARADRQHVAEYLCDIAYGRAGPLRNDQFHTCTRRAILWHRSGSHDAPLLSEEVTVSLRSWLPLHTEVPAPDLWSCKDKKGNPIDPNELLAQFTLRVESMWFPDLPGLSSWDIAENYSEYLGFRAIERWARKNCINGWLTSG